MADSDQKLETTCCIVGGGPAGMMLGFLLARADIEVIVLEKHADFFRDFRGDTIHPSTFQLINELGLLPQFLKVTHQDIQELFVVYNNRKLKIVDFSHLNVPQPKLGLMPQWDFLRFIQEQASKYPAFKLIMDANVTDIIRQNGRVTGVKAVKKDHSTLQVDARLIVGTDGRHSILRERAGLKVITEGVPIDVLWFRIDRQDDDPEYTLGRVYAGDIMVLLNRDTYWQCAYIISKGGYARIQQNGLEAFREQLVRVSPFLANRIDQLKNWDDIKLLSVDIDHLEKWYIDGLLCIGDAAHAMSPVGGVGINLAIQDAVAAANVLYKPLSDNKAPDTDILRRVQQRRMLPARVIQKIQVIIHNGMISNKAKATPQQKPPLFMRVLNRIPLLRRIPARILGLGIRPEHIKTPVKML